MTVLRQALTRPTAGSACTVLALLVLLLAPGASRAAPSGFDHFSTGFELLGQHLEVACESCHVGGIFKGTPHDCFACHAAGSRIGASAKPTKHIVSSKDCAQCHTPFAWKPVAQFDHLNVVGTCSSCHNNVQAIGKGPTHVATTLECNACHKVMQPFTAGLLIPPNHIPYSSAASCTACHKTNDFSVIPSLTDIHANAQSTTGNCIQCHGSAAASYAIPAAGFSIVGIPAKHISSNADAPCETCHVGATSSIKVLPVVDGAKFTNSAMSHAGLTTCVSCHGPTAGGFVGISQLVVMPATSPPGANSHIPSVTACEGCHVAPGTPVPANAPTLTLGATGFLMPLPSTGQIHANIASNNCSSCHEGGNVWVDMGQYPLIPGTLGVSSTHYMGFQARPLTAASGFSIADPAHPTMGDCSQCHTRTDYFEGNVKPPNHIPYLASATCESCHKDPNFSVSPSLTDIHANAQSTTGNCIQCHGSAAASFAIPAANFKIVGIPAKHVTSNPDLACESCHVGANSSIKALPVVNGATFAGSAMNHALVTDCASCHGPATTGFTGVAQLVIMPPSSPMGPNSHIPSMSACADCHVAPSGLSPASAPSLAIGSTGFLTLHLPTTAEIHTGITGNCASCHEGSNVWADMGQYPLTPGTLGVSTTHYMGFQTRPLGAAVAFSIADGAHPTMGDCSQCHTRTDYFEGTVKPTNHIPYAAAATCESCHKNPVYSVSPSLTDIHANAQSTTTNCIQCHGSAAASFAIPAANNFAIVGIPAKHITSNADAPCETCHVGATSSIATLPVLTGATFKNSAMSHAGVTTCVGCHGTGVGGFVGIAQLVVMPPTSPAGANSHIPSVTACEGCHVAPGALVAASAPSLAIGTTGFLTLSLPTTAQIHNGIISKCASCHEGGNVWADMGQYPLAPAALTGNSSSQYKGFQTRPLAAAAGYSIADPAHPTASAGDCSVCHASTDYFDGLVKPANHIPYAAAAACNACHKSTDNSVWPALTDIHANAQSTTTNCIQCHGSAAASFAIPAANNFAIVGIPAKHITSNADAPCETCHVGATSSIKTLPVLNGASFKNSAMSHAGLTTCVGCHGTGVGGFVGITQLVVLPPTSPSGASSHVPYATVTDCSVCHIAPAALVPANAPSLAIGATGFLTLHLPATTEIHAGITSGCSSCHEGGNVWADMTQYPIAPATLGAATTQYTGFQTRPGSTKTTAFVLVDAAHPPSGDCVTCHGTNFNYFSGQAEPSNHIPTTTNTCSVCHTTAGNYAVWSGDLTTLHANVPTTCSTCHADGKGPFAGPTGFTIVQTSTRGVHIPITKAGVPVECSGCHKSVTTFTGTIMSHAAIGDSGTSAAGNACDACHESGYRNKFFGVSINFTRDSPNHYICGAPGTPTAPNVQICANGGSDCLTGCHQHQNNIPAKYASVRPKTPQKQIQGAASPALPKAAAPAAAGAATPHGRGIGPSGRGATAQALTGGKVDHAALAGRSCQSCHNGAMATGKGPAHPLTNGACGDCHSTLAWQPVLRIDHADVVGHCASCHNGTLARAKPASHPLAGNDCDRCHTTSAWKPAAFDHRTVMAGTCASCHNALTATGKPAGHVATLLSCDACHYVLGWKPTKPAPAQPPRSPRSAPRLSTAPGARATSALAPPL